MHRTFQSLRRLGLLSARSLIDFVFPDVCPLCERELPAMMPPAEGSLSSRICADCEGKLVELPLDLCHGCGARLGPYLTPTVKCHHCHQDRFAFSRVWSLGNFDGDLRRAVLQAKHPGGEPVVAGLVQLLLKHHLSDWITRPPEVIVPIPRHWSERFHTGHHASHTLALCLARELTRQLGRAVPVESELVCKQRRTRKQSRLAPTDRRKNLRDVYQLCDETILQGKSVLIADDVLTTGTTAQRMASLLRRSGGCAEVRVCVLARGIGRQ